MRRAAGWWRRRALEAAIGVTAPTASPASMWTRSPATARRTAAVRWSVWVRKGGEWALIHRCRRCGKLNSNRVAADDNPIKLLSIAMKPLASPPFPLERIEGLTDLLAGNGSLKE